VHSSRSVRLALHGLSILSCVALAAVASLELLGPRWHPLLFALAAALPVHFLIAFLALVSSIVARRTHLLRAALALTGVLIAVQADALLSASAARSQTTDSDTTLISANVFAGNVDFDRLAASISRQRVDVLVTVETSNAAEEALTAALPGYSKVSATAARWVPQDNVVIWSKLPITSLAPVVVAGRELPFAEVLTKAGPLRIIGVHLSSPATRDYVQRLNDELNALTQLDLGDTPLVLAGDFNTPTRHPALRNLTFGHSRLADASLATGNIFAATWPAIASEAPIPSPVPVLDIDHVLLSRTAVSAFSVIDLPGSDHRGLAVRIRPKS
jgi:endonuclease/exonuclease/phosphatase (EEP) superfamily protein YafD